MNQPMIRSSKLAKLPASDLAGPSQSKTEMTGQATTIASSFSEDPSSRGDNKTTYNSWKTSSIHRSKQGNLQHEFHGSQDTLPPATRCEETTEAAPLTASESTCTESAQNLQNLIPHLILEEPTPPSSDDESFRDLLPGPVFEEFPAYLKYRRASKIILVLHDYGGNEYSLKNFADEHLREPDTLYILLRGIHPLAEGSSLYHWADNIQSPKDSFSDATNHIAKFILDDLIKKHHFQPRNIILFGLGQGGMVALSVATSWSRTELGGVITVGGSLPKHFVVPDKANVSTPVLVLGGMLGDINVTAKKRIEDFIVHIDVYLTPNERDVLPQSRDDVSLSKLKDFLAHRLWRKEWEQPSILTLGKTSSD